MKEAGGRQPLLVGTQKRIYVYFLSLLLLLLCVWHTIRTRPKRVVRNVISFHLLPRRRNRINRRTCNICLVVINEMKFNYCVCCICCKSIESQSVKMYTFCTFFKILIYFNIFILNNNQ